MGKYSSRSNERSGPNPRTTVSPYMRGIGCLMMAIVPVFSYAVGKLLVDTQKFGWQFFSPDWYVPIRLSPALSQNIIFGYVAKFLVDYQVKTASLVIAAVLAFIIGGFISIVYGYMYTLLAPSKYGPTDVPPPRVKTKKYKR